MLYQQFLIQIFHPLYTAEPPTLTLWLDPASVMKAGVPYQVECSSPVTHSNTEIEMWLNVGGNRHHQISQIIGNEDTKSAHVYAMSMVMFNKTDNQKEISCGAKWRNKTYTSESKKINVLCKYSITL